MRRQQRRYPLAGVKLHQLPKSNDFLVERGFTHARPDASSEHHGKPHQRCPAPHWFQPGVATHALERKAI